MASTGYSLACTHCEFHDRYSIITLRGVVESKESKEATVSLGPIPSLYTSHPAE
jgi:hypothetical protein